MALSGILSSNLYVDGVVIADTVLRLDLTPASRVYLIEPQWNPMLKEQVLDRVHRIGQTMPVTTVRYIII